MKNRTKKLLRWQLFLYLVIGLIPTLVPESKATVNHISRQAAEENRDLNIRVHAVCPGMIKNTGLTDRLWESSDKKGVPRPQEALAGVPEDIGRVVLFLCSDLGAFVDGSITAVAGNQFII